MVSPAWKRYPSPSSWPYVLMARDWPAVNGPGGEAEVPKGGAASTLLPQPSRSADLEQVAQAVAHEVDRQHGDGQERAREQDDPEGALHVGPPLRHDIAPR